MKPKAGPGRLQGRWALITGASRGIGRAVAEAYAAEGANLFLSASSAASLQSVEQALAGSDVQICSAAADLAEPEQIDALFDAAAAASGGLDILVNNAGIYLGKPFEEYQLTDLDRVMWINVYAVFQLMQRAIVHMRGRGMGKIINIASTAGKWESPNQSVYNASKHAVVGLTRCAALENGGHGLNINAICPGMVATDMFENFGVHAERAGITLDALQAQMMTRIPLGRFLQPEEIAHLAVYLGSGESDGMTGQTLTISGGMRMG